jgi:thioredoxin 2
MEIECPACKTTNRIPWERVGQSGKCGNCKERLPPVPGPLEVSPQEFDAVVKGSKVPVLVDFWAPWCAPCRAASPQVQKAAKELGKDAVVLKVNTEAHPEMNRRFGIRGIPHFMVLKKGEVAVAKSGLVNAQQLVSWVREAAAG